MHLSGSLVSVFLLCIICIIRPNATRWSMASILLLYFTLRGYSVSLSMETQSKKWEGVAPEDGKADFRSVLRWRIGLHRLKRMKATNHK
jgi:hypothetical protein